MKKIKDLLNEVTIELGINMDKQKRYSDEDRLKLLGINDSAAEKIRNMSFEKTDFDESDYGETTYKVMAMDKLVGINRQDDASNWLELLFKLHKKKHFEIYKNYENFEKYVNRLDQACDDLPNVLDIDGKYVVDGNGKHRLTIAKCIGLKDFPVIVTTLK